MTGIGDPTWVPLPKIMKKRNVLVLSVSKPSVACNANQWEAVVSIPYIRNNKTWSVHKTVFLDFYPEIGEWITVRIY